MRGRFWSGAGYLHRSTLTLMGVAPRRREQSRLEWDNRATRIFRVPETG